MIPMDMIREKQLTNERRKQADPFQPNWQSHFWGSNYPRLKQLRKKWDPLGVFYAVATPGTEDWEEIEFNTRLCKKL